MKTNGQKYRRKSVSSDAEYEIEMFEYCISLGVDCNTAVQWDKLDSEVLPVRLIG